MSGYGQNRCTNTLLRAIPTAAFDALRPMMSQVDLPLRHVIVEVDTPLTHVCFIESGLASVVTTTAGNKSIEIGHIGFEGMAGKHVLLDADVTPNRTFMQAAGQGLKVPLADLRKVMNDDEDTRNLFLRYVHCFELQLAHTAIAHAQYKIHQRLARWLLMCHDRLVANDMVLTHEFLALMLGVRRSGVTNEIHVLEGLHAIKATRGNVRVVDRQLLEDIAGGCYGTPEREYARLIGDRAVPLHSIK